MIKIDGNYFRMATIETPELESKLSNENVMFIDVRRTEELAQGKFDAKYFANIPHTIVAQKFALSDDDFLVSK
jgi:rhodanese-related sulfurtransferase